MKRIYDMLSSLNLGLWLICLVMVALAIGSFSPGAAEQAGINDLPLFAWLREVPFPVSWWLWLAIALIAVLVVNTIVCSIEALRKGRSLAPQLMHLGFLCIVLAHLFSAYGGGKQILQVPQGGGIYYPDREQVVVEQITATQGPMGMMSGYSAQLRLADGKVAEVSPNHPMFHKGMGIYLKEVGMMDRPVALFEVHREPGAIPALIGAILFTAGNLMLLRMRRGR
jgi:hypothetical protein